MRVLVSLASLKREREPGLFPYGGGKNKLRVAE